MYEGGFQFGKKHGRGKLTKCANLQNAAASEPIIEIVEGRWENDQLIEQTPQQDIWTLTL